MVEVGALTFFVAISAIMFLFFVYKMFHEKDEAFAGNHRLGVVFFAILTITSGFFEVEHQSKERAASSALSEMLGRDNVSVHCQRITGALFDAQVGTLGYVSQASPNIVLLKRETCADLDSYMHSDKSHPTRDQITAVHILTHESMHVEGWWAEPVAECYAIQHDADTAEILGATKDEALALQEEYYKDFYPNMPDSYTSRQCIDGGELDLNLHGAIFP